VVHLPRLVYTVNDVARVRGSNRSAGAVGIVKVRLSFFYLFMIRCNTGHWESLKIIQVIDLITKTSYTWHLRDTDYKEVIKQHEILC